MADAKAPAATDTRTEWFVASGTLIAALVAYGLQYLPYLSAPAGGMIGGDWDIFLPYLLAGDYWFARNGLFAVPWMAPSLCGGLPFYANPQSIYYSPAQWLTLAVSPLTSVKIVFLLYAAIGGVGMYLVARRIFRLSLEASLLAGVVFLFNGFYAHRILVGHFAFQGFMLAPLATYFLLRPGSRRERAFNGIVAGVLFALMFQSGMVVLAGPVAAAILWMALARRVGTTQLAASGASLADLAEREPSLPLERGRPARSARSAAALEREEPTSGGGKHLRQQGAPSARAGGAPAPQGAIDAFQLRQQGAPSARAGGAPALQGAVDVFMGVAVALATTFSLCAAKLVAAASFVSHFPRDFLPLPGIKSVFRLVATVLQMLFWRSTPEMSHEWSNRRVHMGIHEWEYSLSPVPALLILWLTFARFRRPTPRVPLWRPGHRLLLGAMAFLLLLPLALNFYEPSWNAFLKSLPTMHDVSSLSRWFSFYVPVVSLLAGVGVDAIPKSARPTVAALAGAGVVLFHVTAGPEHGPDRQFHPAEIEDAWAALHDAGKVVPIDHVVISQINGRRTPSFDGDNALVHGGSQGACYEAMFGYQLQTFPFASLHEGPSLDSLNGVLNVKNPACFLYPAENGCVPGEQYRAEQQQTAADFLDWKSIPFEVPLTQRLADVLNIAALVVVPVALLRLRRRAAQKV